MSWTTDRDVAEWFARRYAHLRNGHVVKASVPATAVLAICDEPDGRAEDEVVVNPACLRGAATPRPIL